MVSVLHLQAIDLDPTNATLLSNRSLCWVRLGQPEHALTDAKACRALRPDWSKACYREGAALRLLQVCFLLLFLEYMRMISRPILSNISWSHFNCRGSMKQQIHFMRGWCLTLTIRSLCQHLGLWLNVHKWLICFTLLTSSSHPKHSFCTTIPVAKA